jgi:hypothetical protein
MPDGARHAAKLRERLTNGTEDKLGKALADLLENPLVTGTIGRAFDARERASQAQELALSALNLPTAADIERLTRRLRSVSQRLEGIEDGVHRLNRALSDGAIDTRLATIEEQLKTLSAKLAPAGKASGLGRAAGAGKTATAATPTEDKPPRTRAAASTGKAVSARKAASTRKAAVTGKGSVTGKAAAKAPKQARASKPRKTA